jgi:hypothetical protein
LRQDPAARNGKTTFATKGSSEVIHGSLIVAAPLKGTAISRQTLAGRAGVAPVVATPRMSTALHNHSPGKRS